MSYDYSKYRIQNIDVTNEGQIIENIINTYTNEPFRGNRIYHGYCEAVEAVDHYNEIWRTMQKTTLFFDHNAAEYTLIIQKQIKLVINRLYKIIQFLEKTLMEMDSEKTWLREIEPFKTYYSRNEG